MKRRGFLGLFWKAPLAALAAKIPLISTAARKAVAQEAVIQKVAAQKAITPHGWIPITINNERRYIPFWS